jgi:methylated-DNA-protein-cysteine methyltransferase related protein
VTAFQDEVAVVVGGLQRGEVVSYGDVAHDAGRPGAARAVGGLLSRGPVDPDGHPLPWWRVVYDRGHLPPGDPERQARLLEAEGVQVRDGRVVRAPIGRFSSP